MKKVYFKTFGCRTNQFDTQVMMSRLGEYELARNEEEADVIVVNSCTVTNGADSGVRGYINQVGRINGEAKVLLTGCGAHTKGESLFESGKVHGVFGHSEKEKITKFLEKSDRFYEIGDLEHVDTTVVEQFVGKSRAFIKIQEGCDFRCSYCIIPYVRGDARSLDETLILEQIRRLAANGFGEFILTGTNVGSYGKERGSSIAKLLKRMSQIRGVRRIRIGSLEPIQITDEFKELLDEPWMAKHLHIALQHTSDEMLKLMNRRNDFMSDLKLFEELASHGYALGTDFIVGHPGEGEDQWQEAIERVKMLPLTHIHAFSYSKRDGTPSAVMKPQVPGNIAKIRHRELTQIVKAKNFAFRRSLNEPLEILIESKKDGRYFGLDQYFNKISIESGRDLKGEWLYLEKFEAAEEMNRGSF
ncbi:tRNA (N(6)-L-threonylcarbamoyladenosine(37)-C(2))-methylthiotransferase MtaB [Hydrogenimonas cancrithermarum]|uniref:tRNA (N(6)-L-threonylcarbamoyladenosine(37)-C(2))-methylthiotransferase MtaB n=1 Tax=Hydrogenimonas cancrithermarum TaxID=2993563 RepID=A0ABM8FKN7_9BACT|nr:tRNA (N(6)-L-threonylcarbamoyladenosine(37)-C(2))-methylthiotransferase MtaB [Hydrogenimonas cancrithermarum]BDY11949.1 tRNA (N(6)-L-threonylcarbamoyladenosine(37)-C(2))-methylthiotransferase MtaB [Hydrogenimonas cancrithermarum]